MEDVKSCNKCKHVVRGIFIDHKEWRCKANIAEQKINPITGKKKKLGIENYQCCWAQISHDDGNCRFFEKNDERFFKLEILRNSVSFPLGSFKEHFVPMCVIVCIFILFSIISLGYNT